MKHQAARRLLDRVGVLEHACDLDLLVFFVRHPRALLTSEQLAACLGYELRRIANSLDVLIEAGLLTRTQNPARAARLYVFNFGGFGGGWLPAFVELASTRAGRLILIEELSRRGSRDSDDPATEGERANRTTAGFAPFVVRPHPDDKPRTRAG